MSQADERAVLRRRSGGTKTALIAGLVVASVVFLTSSLWWWPLSPPVWLSGLFLTAALAFLCLGVYLYAIALRRRRVAPGVAGLAILASLFLCALDNAGILWIGSRSEVLTVRVVDQQTGLAVPNAPVRVSRNAGKASKGRTDAAGEAHLTHEFIASGFDSQFGFRKSASVYFGETTVVVTADGYEPVQVPLEEATGHLGWKLGGAPLPVVVVQLRKK
jgi:hypothetical protein